MARIELSEESGLALLEWMRKLKGFLVVNGAPGTGKSFLAAALINHFAAKVPHERNLGSVTYKNERELLAQLRSTEFDYHELMKEKWGDHGLLIIDDVASTHHTPWREEVMYSLIDMRWGIPYPTVLISNLSEREMRAFYNPRICSRIYDKSNYFITTDGPDRRSVVSLEQTTFHHTQASAQPSASDQRT